MRLAAEVLPARDHHDRVERHAQHAAPFDDRADLVVGELAIPGGEGAAVLVRGPDWSVEDLEGLPEVLVAEMGDIENHPEAIHLFEEAFATGGEGATGIGAVGVDPGAIVSGAQGAQAIVVTLLEVADRDERVGPFEAEQIANGSLGGGGPGINGVEALIGDGGLEPELDVAVEFGAGADRGHFPGIFHRAIPGQLALGLGPRLGGRIPAREAMEVRGVAANLGGDADTNATATHLREADSAIPAIDAIFHVAFPAADHFERPGEIAVPLEGVHAQVEVAVENQRRGVGSHRVRFGWKWDVRSRKVAAWRVGRDAGGRLDAPFLPAGTLLTGGGMAIGSRWDRALRVRIAKQPGGFYRLNGRWDLRGRLDRRGRLGWSVPSGSFNLHRRGDQGRQRSRARSHGVPSPRHSSASSPMSDTG